MNVRLTFAAFSMLLAASFLSPAFAADIAAGQRIYRHTCKACHGANGKSPLPKVPDFRQPGGVLSQPDTVLLDRIEHGYRGPGSQLAMPPKGGNASLTAEDLKNVLAYLHHAFGDASANPPSNGASGTTDRGMMGNGMRGNGMMGGGMMRR